jgi:peptide/nickel transport system substrate-binding protein
VKGVRYESYHHEGKPYLDGYTSIIAPKMSVRLQAIRSGRADIEFRGFPPKARDDLVSALGDRITVQESDWNCALIVTPNHKVEPFDDPRVRRALSLAIDRWGGSKYLSEIAIVKTVGGIGFPGHPLASSDDHLAKNVAGYGRDIEANRKEARRLLQEAGQENLSFTLHNRGVDQPYKVVGTWLIDHWRRIGVEVEQWVQPTAPFYATLRKQRDFQVSLDFNCHAVVNAIIDVSKFLPSGDANYAQFEDQELETLYLAMLRSPDPAEQKLLMEKFEKRVLDDLASQFVTLWWYKINPYRSYVKGWKIAPSHILNQSLDGIWIDQAEYRRQQG